ncbi:putative bifunctional diguanylate cyclase/phosphodiesterase [Kineococcus terrestris]|uniref:putative bifunctional diguanylate cyclase/phosphodiesterase n=1 Tax=Kineococcus terrestris TaxID=2044856 RepID=UPI0034DAD858
MPVGPTPADRELVEVVEVVRTFTRTVTGDFSAEDLLRRLAEAAVRILHADGAGVVVPGADGRLVLAHSLHEGVRRLEDVQELLQEGPCQDCVRHGRVVASGDLAADGDWPRYQAEAVALGVRTVAAVPLPGRDGPLGVLDVYRTAPRPFSARELATTGLLADLAASYLSVVRDRDEARRARQELAHRAAHDPLTGLPVRWAFLQRLDEVVATSPRPGSVAVLFVDLDGLKYANDTYGHLAGDQLIRVSAQRLRRALRPDDLVARIGGDEFVVLLQGLASPARATAVAQRVVEEFAVPADADDLTVQPSASIGVAVLGPDDRVPADTLVSHADAAMYLAKQRGRGRWALFDPAAYADATSRADLVPALRRALADGQLHLRYQPVVDLGTGRAVAVEALLRWEHPERGTLTADEFVPAAEHSGLVRALGAWVLRTACRQLAAWDEELGARSPRRLFVNVSVLELGDPLLEHAVARTLDDSGLAAERLVLEITESAFLHDPAGATVLARLRRRGCAVAIDDFGAGWSSLSRLVHLPVSVLKVDRAFTEHVVAHREAATVVASVLRLGEELGCDVVVEGVEDAATLERLTALGCRYAQGFHLARPLTAEQLARWCADGPPAAGRA